MVGSASGRVALFSIHPQYAHAILDGSKQVEFRRQGLADDVTHAVIYATSPLQQVVGMFEVAGVEKLTPSRAWGRYGRVGGIDKTAFERYYTDAAYAYVIRVRSPRTFPTPFVLADLAEDLRPPQSYMYLRDDVLDRARVLCERATLEAPGEKGLLKRLASKVLAPVAR